MRFLFFTHPISSIALFSFFFISSLCPLLALVATTASSISFMQSVAK